ncbi:RsiV family protein [Psychrobacter urativorans]|uniref:DUF3298 domain-containing protein n=1 Tax=Psychrobacter urativorans TaxID=45610 RepID=A0A0M4T303_9GAMM|nr:RsiV family protein [Psychrobacter urativorans]ALF60078.1 hypothetical protein AOC03_08540 [Psychrobacter urativorans]
MTTLNPLAINKPFMTQQTSAIYNRSRLLSLLVSGVLLGAASLSANASTLISSTDYLDYSVPKNIQERCVERDNCPNIEVHYLKTNRGWMNKITNARINNLVINSKPSESKPSKATGDAKVVKAAIDGFVASQFADIPDDSVFVYQLMVKPDYLGHVDNFEMFEISSYVFTGGAHGMPYSEYLIFDPSTKKQVRLDDMLQTGKKPRFKALAYEAYKTWVKTVDEDLNSYEKNWPFTLDDNVTLTDKGIDVRYQHYAIGPYAYGMPVLSIPYSKLSGVIKPHFMPK